MIGADVAFRRRAGDRPGPNQASFDVAASSTAGDDTNMHAKPLFFLAFGCAMLAVSLACAVRWFFEVKQGAFYHGRIRDFATINGGEGPGQFPIIEYLDTSGNLRTFRSSLSSDRMNWIIGANVKIRMVRGKPHLHNACIEGGVLGTVGFCGLVSIWEALRVLL